ncbi:hypothetical protein [Taylorella equigenitalis]|uniref:hypothetical protein n=1 Tax=Taylorella equigenitalis TaxID=29575 RepID=UPI000406E1DA|nr:hypothetical protein [Taylorella equigenitalis]WDU53482.1 hypothetical protein KNO31_00580 [Taylorella equigenitalis]WDU54976.1 hypothetical protein KPZ19_00710 [Taylorella equigenitalis]
MNLLYSQITLFISSLILISLPSFSNENVDNLEEEIAFFSCLQMQDDDIYKTMGNSWKKDFLKENPVHDINRRNVGKAVKSLVSSLPLKEYMYLKPESDGVPKINQNVFYLCKRVSYNLNIMSPPISMDYKNWKIEEFPIISDEEMGEIIAFEGCMAKLGHESFIKMSKPKIYTEQIKKLGDELRKLDLKDSKLAVRECFNFSKKGRIKSFTGK